MRYPNLKDFPPPPPGKRGWPWTEKSAPLPPTMPNGEPWPKISIVTPSFNQGQFIEETIRSVLLQNYPNLEYIIIDGGSTDNSVEIIKKYEPWLTYWVSEKDNGQSHAINKGFMASTGKIMAWLCSDDLYQMETLKFVSMNLSTNEPNWLIGGANIINSNTKLILIREVNNNINIENFLNWLNFYFPQPSVFWTNFLWLNINKLNENLHYTMDIDLWFKMYKIISPKILNKILSSCRAHHSSKTSFESNTYETFLEEYKFWIQNLINQEKNNEINKEIAKTLVLLQMKHRNIERIKKHIIIGEFIKLWNNFINKKFDVLE